MSDNGYMLSTRELTQARADVAETLVDTCVIERAVGTTTNYLARQAWGTAGTAACRIDPYNPWRDMKGVTAGRESTRAYLQASFAWDADIDEGDRVVFAGETLEIVELQDIHSDRLVTRAILAKIEGA